MACRNSSGDEEVTEPPLDAEVVIEDPQDDEEATKKPQGRNRRRQMARRGSVRKQPPGRDSMAGQVWDDGGGSGSSGGRERQAARQRRGGSAELDQHPGHAGAAAAGRAGVQPSVVVDARGFEPQVRGSIRLLNAAIGGSVFCRRSAGMGAPPWACTLSEAWGCLEPCVIVHPLHQARIHSSIISGYTPPISSSAASPAEVHSTPVARTVALCPLTEKGIVALTAG